MTESNDDFTRNRRLLNLRPDQTAWMQIIKKWNAIQSSHVESFCTEDPSIISQVLQSPLFDVINFSSSADDRITLIAESIVSKTMKKKKRKKDKIRVFVDGSCDRAFVSIKTQNFVQMAVCISQLGSLEEMLLETSELQ